MEADGIFNSIEVDIKIYLVKKIATTNTDEDYPIVDIDFDPANKLLYK